MVYELELMAGKRQIRYWAEVTESGTCYAATTEHFPAQLFLTSSALSDVAPVFSPLYESFTELEGKVLLVNEPPTSSPELRKLTPDEEQEFLKELKGE